MRFYLLLCMYAALLLAGPKALAQQDTTKTDDGLKILGINLDTLLTPKLPKVDTSYITSYKNKLHVHLLLEDTDYALRLINDDHRLIYKPNISSSAGIGLSYSWLSFDVTLRTRARSKNDMRGNTDQVRFGLSVNGRKVQFSTNYQKYAGLYLSNTDVLAADWFQESDTYPLRPDITSKTFYSRLYYTFNNEEFSHPATTFQRERQKKSAGSFLVGATFVSSQVEGDSSLIPLKVQPYFPEEANLQRYRTTTYTVNAGYAYTWVFKKYLFVSASFRPGLGLRHQTGTLSNNEETSIPVKLGLQGDGRGTIGFNSDKYYGGLTGTLLFSSSSLESNNRQRSYYSEVRVLVGRRFGYKAKGIFSKIPGF
ncbi:DUF4421 family protein [Pontibacter liquoris]|uniref:DUF4421 family protein n=1 Tax=Pontibacter liquoris TaxID=2905677 RepID=UPI001FA718B4|nr:DUF4421 family protein [Pontibacter liquoris]